jgi:hypothetical protein
VSTNEFVQAYPAPLVGGVGPHAQQTLGNLWHPVGTHNWGTEGGVGLGVGESFSADISYSFYLFSF